MLHKSQEDQHYLITGKSAEIDSLLLQSNISHQLAPNNVKVEPQKSDYTWIENAFKRWIKKSLK